MRIVSVIEWVCSYNCRARTFFSYVNNIPISSLRPLLCPTFRPHPPALELRRISLVWCSFWHRKTPYLLDSISYCLTNGVQFTFCLQGLFVHFTEAHEDRCGFGTGCSTLRSNGACRTTVDQADRIRPFHRIKRPAADRACVLESAQVSRLAGAVLLELRIAHHHGSHLFTGDLGIWSEAVLADAVYYAVHRSPLYGIRIPLAGRHIREDRVAADSRRAGHTVQYRNDWR